MEGYYRSKCGATKEGVAVFFNKAKFTYIQKHDIDLKDCFEVEFLKVGEGEVLVMDGWVDV